MNVLKISVQVQQLVDTSTFYELAVKSLNVFNIEQKHDIEYIFKNIIFSKDFYPSDVLIKHLNIRDGDPNILLNNLEEVLQVYSQVLGLKNVSTVIDCYLDFIFFFW